MRAIVGDYYDRHWERRMQAEPAVATPWDRIGFLCLLGKCGVTPGRVLDVGCGIGHTLLSLATMPGVESLAGVEPSPAAAAEARRRVPAATVHEGFAEDLRGVADGAFDTVTLAAVLEHIYDTHRALNEVNRVLQPGGLVALYTTDFNWLKKVLVAMFAFEKCFDVCGGHIRFFTKRSLRAVMAEHGFDLVKHEWDTTYCGIMPQGQNAVYRKVCDERLVRETV
jgi:2-polyprenyl-3-methyl-5-hydroxy-6-metoxy-1,4-benzoquinol methylase